MNENFKLKKEVWVSLASPFFNDLGGI